MLARTAVLRGCVIACMAGAALPVAADEAYLCGPSKIVYVKADDIEARKLSDPCIASHYGLTVQAKAQTPAHMTAVPLTDAAKKPAETALHRHEAVAIAPLSAAIAARQAKIAKTVKRAIASSPAHAAPIAPPVAAPGTDYRNVRVINASTSNEAWYRHVR